MSRDRREENTDCKVYCGGLPADATSQELEDSFNRYGPIRKVWIARKPPGFAFIEFEDSRDADDAVRGLDGGRVCGGRVHVELSRGRGGGRRGGGGGDYRGGGGGDYRGGRGGGGGGRYSGGASGNDRGGRHSRSRSPPARRDARHSPKRSSRSPRPNNGSKGNNDRRRSPSVSPPPRGSPPIRRASPPAERSRSVSAD